LVNWTNNWTNKDVQSYCVGFPQTHFLYLNRGRLRNYLYLFFEKDKEIFFPFLPNTILGWVCVGCVGTIEQALDSFWNIPFGNSLLDVEERTFFLNDIRSQKINMRSLDEEMKRYPKWRHHFGSDFEENATFALDAIKKHIK